MLVFSSTHYCTSKAEKMIEICLYFVLIFISTSIVHGLNVNSYCDGDWLPYRDEKCVRLFETFAQRNVAEEICSQHDATLVTIKTAAEQKFFTELVFNSSVSNSVWLGAERRTENEAEFVWSHGSAVLRFANWAVGRPSVDVRRSCVQMQSELSRQVPDLEWADIGCTVGNWFICEKEPIWSFDNLQRAVISARRDMEYNVNSVTERLAYLRTKLNNANTEINFLRDNLLPIGFVYTQLPNQQKPSIIWGLMEWTEITEQYAGLFFRAVGGNSSAFEIMQEGSSPRLTHVEAMNLDTANFAAEITSNGHRSPSVSSGASGGWTHWGLSFTVSSGEVRPRNTAIRIWIRTK